MLVLLADGLNEAHAPEVALPVCRRGGELHEFALVPQVLSTRRRPGSVVGKVIQRLVVEHEQLVRAIGVGRLNQYRVVMGIRARRPGAVRVPLTGGVARGAVPAPRIPGPVDAACAEAVTDIRRRQRPQAPHDAPPRLGWLGGWFGGGCGL